MTSLLPPLALLALLACKDKGGATIDDTGGSTENLGQDPSVLAAAGEARAGVVREGEAGEAALFGGVTAEGRAGDIKLYNSIIQVVIQGGYEGHGYIDGGGAIIDVDLVRQDSLGRDLVEDIFLGFGFARLFHADSVVVVADGSDGGAAIVRATGTDVPWKFMQGLFEYDDPTVPDLGLSVETTYTLEPDSHVVDIRSSLTNDGDETVSFVAQAGSFSSGEDLLPWAPGIGFQDLETGPMEAALFTGKQGEATWSSWSSDGLSISILAALTAELGIFVADYDEVTLAPGESTVLSRSLAVAADTATAEALRREQAGEDLALVSGTVTEGGAGVAGLRVHLVGEDGVAGFAMSQADGSWSARLPAGSWTAYAVADADTEQVQHPAAAGRFGPFAATTVNEAHLQVLRGDAQALPLPYATGRATPEPVAFDLDSGGATVDLAVPPASSLQITLVDDGGQPVPGVIDLRWADGAPPAGNVPDELRDALNIDTGGRAFWGWTSTGTMDLPALPGDYAISAGYSWRHGMDSATLTVAEGEAATVTLTLDEVIPRDGWLALDPHLHGSPSFDGALPMEDRLITCAATGVELPVMTDHDAVVDYRDLAAALGLDGRMHVVPGTEVTPLRRGHFNIYPLDPQPLAANNGGAVDWWNTPDDTAELFERMRVLAGDDGLIQINHPRTPGMFDFAGFDTQTATPAKDDYWSWDFETFELLNGGVSDLEDLREDWFSLLDFGLIRTPTGASDTHYRYIPCGMARTDLYVGTSDPAEVTDDMIRDALLAGHVVVASGTTLRASVDGAMPGDTVTGGRVTVTTTVQAPAWIEPGTLRIYRGGEVVVEETEGPWTDATWTIDADADTWIVVEVDGDTPQGDIWRNAEPYAATNAFFVDVAGDGWEAPLTWGG